MNQTIKLDTRKRDGTYGEERIAPLRRGERNNALLTVKVCANGQPYDLAGKTASLVATTAAGKLVGPCPMEVAEAGIARIMLPAALYSAVGSFRGYVEIREGDTLVDTTDRFGGKVIECADLDSEQAAEFTPLLGELQNAVTDEAKRVEAEKDRAQAETERVKVENDRGKAEEKRAQDSKTRLEELAQAKTNAETATGEANTARDEAKSAAADATSAAGKATDAAGLAETAKTNANTAAEEANAAATKAEAAARKADGAAETAGTAASTAELAANKADTAAVNAESMAEKADASANKADIAAGKANEATVAATNAATKANEVEAKLTGNILKGKVKDTFVHVDDAFAGAALREITVEGACKQDGTPSPDNPVPIEVIEHPVVKVTGRNLLKVANAKVTNRGVTLESKDGIFTLSGTATKSGYSGSTSNFLSLDALINKQVIMTIHVISGNVPTIVALNDKYNWIRSFNGEKNELKSSVKYISASCTEGTTYDCKFYLSVEAYDTDGSYYPSVYQQQTFTLPPEHPYLAKLPDGTADEIIVDKDGNVSLVANVTTYALTNCSNKTNEPLEQTGADGTKNYLFSFSPVETVKAGNGIPCYCNVLKDGGISKNRDTIRAGENDKGTYVYTSNEELIGDKTASHINSWMAEHNALVYRQLAESQTYQLGKIEMPKAQDSIVNAWTDAEVTLRTGIEYTRDVNIVVANLESAIASITQG